MKTIKEKANNYAETRYPKNSKNDAYSAARNGFMAGAECAQRWINVADELPEDGEEDVLCRLWNDKYSMGFCWDGTWFLDPEFMFKLHRVTHWRPIELK